MSSGMLKTKDLPLNWPLLVATGPALSVKLDGVGDIDETSTLNLNLVLDDFLERGTYPIFLANATTFSLKVAESIKTSLATMFALYEVMYVL